MPPYSLVVSCYDRRFAERVALIIEDFDNKVEVLHIKISPLGCKGKLKGHRLA